jgi:hypothetical protein
MSDSEESQELSFEEGQAQAQKYSELTKEYVAELPDGGVWRFEFGMLDSEEQLVDKHTTVKKGRSGVEEDTDFEALRFDAFCEGIVDAPDGFPVSPTKLQNASALTKKIVKQVADEIIDFTTADPETVRKFH